MSVKRIEEKRALLRWLMTKKADDAISLSNYLCLADELQKAGWKQTSNSKLWQKGDCTLPLIEAAKKEFAEQAEADRIAHLKGTVKNFKFKEG